ncbi:hypothetical protein [Enterococcus durans]|uniref:hypothetical protein n=1 Tax=Enterococcus durans TaxID=53345 RepID=UPI00071C1509|nr:hypothetical protein [Enterococcus durans]KST44468.1 hypothetical protein AOY33_14595 [Enterococcus durans]
MDSGFLWNITSTVLALFIPIATFLFENENAVDWDKMVVFDQVIKIKKLSFGLILLTLPLLFYQKNSASNEFYRKLNCIVLLLYVIGISLSILSLVRCYFWIINKRTYSKNNSSETVKYRTECRKRYISNLSKNEAVQKEIWSLIWNSVDQHGEIEEIDLMDMYIDQCEENKDYEKKLEFMSIFFTSIDMNKFDEINTYNTIDYDVYERLSKFIYSEIKCVYLEGKNIDIKKVNDFFDIYTKNSIFNWNSSNRYNQFLSQFLEELSGEEYRLFLNNNILKLISYAKKANSLSLVDNLDNLLPDKLIYDENEDNSQKQIIIFELYLKWLSSLSVSPESNDDDKYFANKLFQFIFPDYSSMPFFTLINFMLYVKKHLGYDDLVEMIKAYDKEPYPFKGINTGSDMAMISGETVEEILANYKEQNIKTLELIKKNIKYYDPLLANKENIDELLNAIADSDVRSPRIDELKEEILMYKELF